jgi:hypothetical protein
MDPTTLSVLIFILAVLAGVTAYQTFFTSGRELDERLLIQGPARTPKIGAAPADRLLRWHIRRLRETKSKNARNRNCPEP